MHETLTKTETRRASSTVISAEDFLIHTIIPFFQNTPPKSKEQEKKVTALPYADQLDTALPQLTSFVFDELESAKSMIAQLQQDCPGITASREVFIEHVGRIYDDLAQ